MIKPDHSWTLFLDRDGVINTELPGDYVKFLKDFRFEKGSLEAIAILSKLFERVIIITNQRGVGIGAMTADDLSLIHNFMLEEIKKAGGRIDAIYYCADADRKSPNRKPGITMALSAKKDFPEIDFSKTLMVGNTTSDMQFGKAIGALTVFIDDKKGRNGIKDETMDYIYNSLYDFAKTLGSQ